MHLGCHEHFGWRFPHGSRLHYLVEVTLVWSESCRFVPVEVQNTFLGFFGARRIVQIRHGLHRLPLCPIELSLNRRPRRLVLIDVLLGSLSWYAPQAVLEYVI